LSAGAGSPTGPATWAFGCWRFFRAIFTDAIPVTDWPQTDARESVRMELVIPLVVFVVVLAFVAWKTPSASRR